MQGDFNARTGNLQDLVEHSKFFEDENDITSVNTNSNFEYTRNTEDCVVNSRGRDLIDLCHTSELYIANGRVLGDCKGKNTCFQWNGCTLVDYLIVSNTIYNSLNYFQIGELIPWISDHCPLTYSLSLVNGVTLETDDTKLIDIPGKIVWEEVRIEMFRKLLCSEKIKDILGSLSEKSLKDNSPSSCIQTVKIITDLFNAIVNDCNIRTKPKV